MHGQPGATWPIESESPAAVKPNRGLPAGRRFYKHPAAPGPSDLPRGAMPSMTRNPRPFFDTLLPTAQKRGGGTAGRQAWLAFRPQNATAIYSAAQRHRRCLLCGPPFARASRQCSYGRPIPHAGSLPPARRCSELSDGSRASPAAAASRLSGAAAGISSGTMEAGGPARNGTAGRYLADFAVGGGDVHGHAGWAIPLHCGRGPEPLAAHGWFLLSRAARSDGASRG
jgi:hypothetical protein